MLYGFNGIRWGVYRGLLYRDVYEVTTYVYGRCSLFLYNNGVGVIVSHDGGASVAGPQNVFRCLTISWGLVD